jgi:NADH:ubiquinone oxidoreductase subunit 6 (subunit J)
MSFWEFLRQNAVFLVLVPLTIIPAVMVVLHRNVIHAAVYLGLSFFGVAGLYLALNAPFLAGAQVLIYVGAITVLILFALMMTAQRIMREPRDGVWYRVFAGVLSLVLFLVLGMYVARQPVWATHEAPPAVDAGYLDTLAQSLLGVYLLPFEIASVLLLVALVGAIVLAKEEREA